jgi:hypothetical protein
MGRIILSQRKDEELPGYFSRSLCRAMTVPRVPSALFIGLLATSCVTQQASPPLPMMESRQTGEWRRTAKQIQLGQSTVYYHGTAKRESSQKASVWSGTITGDIFVSGPKGYLLIPNGKLTIARDQKFTVEGASRTVILEGSHPAR